jgi:hypothetical protein
MWSNHRLNKPGIKDGRTFVGIFFYLIINTTDRRAGPTTHLIKENMNGIHVGYKSR